MQPRSWSPSHPLSPALPRSFSIRISQTALSLPAALVYKYHQFTPLVLWSNRLFCHTNLKEPGRLFPPKMPPCPPLCLLSLSLALRLCQIFALFFIPLTISPPLTPTHSNPLLSPIFPFLSPSLAPWTLSNSGKNTQRQIHRGKHREGKHTHTLTHTETHSHTYTLLPPHILQFTLLFCHSPLPLQISPDPL